MAEEALALHLKGMMEDGEEMPEPLTLDAISVDPDGKDAAAYLVVEVPEVRARTVRVNITLSEMTLRQIDAAAKARHVPLQFLGSCSPKRDPFPFHRIVLISECRKFLESM